MTRSATSAWSADATVVLDSGRLRGSAHDDGRIRRFLGVRYAEPPTGDLRWRPPVPARGWSGTRDAQVLPPSAMQLPATPDSLYSGGEDRFSEDCLFLDIWTGSAQDHGRPVLVWLHWGGFQFGSASNPVYDGEALARAGATVVAVGYRLGRLGFLAHPDLTAESDHGSSGNYGLLDQLEALRWVQRHIADFGGDPHRVTLIGCSAGAISTWLLRSAPLATGLFHRAIAHSGLGFAPATDGYGRAGLLQTLPAAEEAGSELATALGVSDLRGLRALPAEAILRGRLARQSGSWSLPFLPPGVGVSDAPFDTGYPIVDGHVLPRTPREVFEAGDQIDVPMIAGTTGNEGSGLPYIGSRDTYEATIRATYGDLAEELLELYPAGDDDDARTMSNRLIGDRMFEWGTWTGLRLDARTGATPTYGYRFLRESPIATNAVISEGRDRAAAYHGADVQYLFDTFDAHDWPWTPGDRRLGGAMRRAWLAFADTGDPDGHGLPPWPVFEEAGSAVMMLDLSSRVGGVPHRDRLGFWDRYFAR